LQSLQLNGYKISFLSDFILKYVCKMPIFDCTPERAGFGKIQIERKKIGKTKMTRLNFMFLLTYCILKKFHSFTKGWSSAPSLFY